MAYRLLDIQYPDTIGFKQWVPAILVKKCIILVCKDVQNRNRLVIDGHTTEKSIAFSKALQKSAVKQLPVSGGKGAGFSPQGGPSFGMQVKQRLQHFRITAQVEMFNDNSAEFPG
jgi:hypothetical protein